MKCHKLNDLNFITRSWHRLWCAECRRAQSLDAMIGFGLMQMKAEPLAAANLESALSTLSLQQGGRNVRRASRRMAGRWMRQHARNLAGIGVAGFLWWQYMNYIPAIHIPAKSVPSQNAFDYFKAAGSMVEKNKSLGDELAEAQQLPGDPPTRERRDARLKRKGKPLPFAIIKSDAKAQVIGGSVPVRLNTDTSVRMPYTREEKQQILDENQQALAKAREGLQYPYMDVYPRRSDALFPYYTDFRQMARLLKFEADMKAERGDWNGAMQSSLDAMQMGVDIEHGGPLIGRLVGIACETIGQASAWKIVEHLDAQQAKAAVARLQSIRANHAPFVETMQEEKWFMLESLRDQMHKPGWRASFSTLTGNSSQDRAFALMMLGWSNRVILRDITNAMDENIRRCGLPYAQDVKLGEAKIPFDPLVQILFPIFSQARYKDVYSSETQSALLVTALALSAYRLEHGNRLPDRLELLTPQYLAQVLADPFAVTNAPLRYHKTSNLLVVRKKSAPQEALRITTLPASYTLYSVGPDGKDDGGTAIDENNQPNSNHDPNAPKRSVDNKKRFLVQPTSQGDIVAGVNTR